MSEKQFELQNVMFRASRLGDLMTGAKVYTPEERLTLQMQNEYPIFLKRKEEGTITATQEKKLVSMQTRLTAPNPLMETAKNYCYEVFLEERYGFKDRVSTPAMRKGIEAENDSLQLLSEHTGTVLFKNEHRLYDERIWLTGEYDARDAEDVIYDVKTSWSPYTFLKADITSDYEWQLRAYMHLAGAKKAVLAFCLVDMPATIFADLERRAMWQANEAIDPASDAGMKITEQLQRNFMYQHNPDYRGTPRVKTYEIEYCPKKQEIMEEQLDRAKRFTECLTLTRKP